MENYHLLSFLLLLFFSTSSDWEQDIYTAEEYAEFKVEPNYITHPTAERKDYFEAYDKVMEHWGVDYDELYINTSKGVAHVIMSGPVDGSPVVLLHGMSASSTMWYFNAKALAKEHRLFAVDLIIEPGKSYKTSDIKNIKKISAWYGEVFEQLKLDSFHLIGTSRGGWLAMDIALKNKKTKSVILLSPVQTFVWTRMSKGLLKNMLNVFYPKEQRPLRTMETLSNDPGKISKDYIEQYRLALKNDSLNKFMLQMKPFPRKKLRSLEVPVLLLIGDRDLFNPPRSIRVVHKHISKGRGEIISNSGHFLSVDQTEVVNHKMLDFLRAVDRAD